MNVVFPHISPTYIFVICLLLSFKLLLRKN